VKESAFRPSLFWRIVTDNGRSAIFWAIFKINLAENPHCRHGGTTLAVVNAVGDRPNGNMMDEREAPA
jgi:hypothetical protein